VPSCRVYGEILSGVCLFPDGQLRINLRAEQIPFDSTSTWRLVFKLDGLAEEAKEWLPQGKRPAPVVPPVTVGSGKEEADGPDGEETREGEGDGEGDPGADPQEPPVEPPEPGLLRRIWRALIGGRDPVRLEAAIRPHSMRAYSLSAVTLATVEEEYRRVRNEDHGREKGEKAPGREPSAEFEGKLETIEAELKDARARFTAAAQRMASSRYWRGTMVGACLLFLICLAGGALFFAFGVSAAYGIALPAGGLGAMVSVLQRMSSGKLVLDVEAGRDLIEAFGAVRPFIGGVFGLALMAVLVGNLIPAIKAPVDGQLAFFAGIGFLAGFNERWAQDMLKGSRSQLDPGGSGSGDTPAA
jgi:hypothetical protein